MDIFSIFDKPKPPEKPKSQTEDLLAECKNTAADYGVTVADVLMAKMILILGGNR